MFLVIMQNGYGMLGLVAECKTRAGVVKWYEANKNDDVFVIKADTIKEFIEKSE